MADVVEDLNAMHKRVYSKRRMPNLIPDIAKVQKLINFSEREKLGDKFVVGVRLAYPNGFTHAKGDGTAGAFNLNDAKAGTYKRAEMDPFQILLRDQMSYEDAGKAVKGERSFVNGVEAFYEGIQLSGRKRIETLCLYGGMGIGTVGSYTSGDPSITISLAEWAPQIWAGIEGAEIDIHNQATSTVRGTVTIAGVDIENRKITLSTTVAGTTANDIVRVKGGYGNEMPGIHYIQNNTGSLFGIDAAVYSLWKGTTHAVGGAFSFQALKKGISKAVGKGLYGKLDLLLNPKAWDDLQTSIEALRVTSEKDVRKVTIGTEEIEYRSQNGITVIHSHPMVKEGYGHAIVKGNWMRVGSVDFELGAPGFGGTPWFHLQSKAGVEARAYTNQGIICEKPAQNILFTGIVNSAT
jgi:hypothetical protein